MTPPLSPERQAALKRARRINELNSRDDITTLTDDELADVLTDSYEASTVPPCRICGGPLSLEACGGGQPHVWACRPDNEDNTKKPGRTFADQHYSQSTWHDHRRGGDSRVMEVLRRLRARQPMSLERAKDLTKRMLDVAMRGIIERPEPSFELVTMAELLEAREVLRATSARIDENGEKWTTLHVTVDPRLAAAIYALAHYDGCQSDNAEPIAALGNKAIFVIDLTEQIEAAKTAAAQEI